jgi:tRNA-dihydrouridine synthase
MKSSELKKEIKDYIYEILSEVDEATYVGAGAVADIQKDPNFSKIKDKASAVNTLKAGESVTLEEEDEDREPTKAELEKEKVKTISKFKVDNDQFQDFKTKLSTLVKKIKGMEKGDERTKKMAALKQFIKKPELVKAFKERDVKIDTGDLIG